VITKTAHTKMIMEVLHVFWTIAIDLLMSCSLMDIKHVNYRKPHAIRFGDLIKYKVYGIVGEIA